MEIPPIPTHGSIDPAETYQIPPADARQEALTLWANPDLRELSTGPDGVDVRRLAHEVSVVLAQKRFDEAYNRDQDMNGEDPTYRQLEAAKQARDRYVTFGPPPED